MNNESTPMSCFFPDLFDLSPMAAATYACNLIHKKAPASENPEAWFTRLYPPDRKGGYEGDPRSHLNKRVSKEAFEELQKLNGGMFVGGITQLNQALRKLSPELLTNIGLGQYWSTILVIAFEELDSIE